jgi:hypothetical protein
MLREVGRTYYQGEMKFLLIEPKHGQKLVVEPSKPLGGHSSMDPSTISFRYKMLERDTHFARETF